MKTFTYEFEVGPESYSEETDEIFYDTEDYDYEVDYDRVRDAIANILVRDYCLDYKNALKLVIDLDLDDNDYFDDELKDIFEDDARKEFEGE